MGKKIVYYALLVTGIVVVLVGLQNVYIFWGDVSMAGLTGQGTVFVCVLGGFVNLWAARKVKKPQHVGN